MRSRRWLVVGAATAVLLPLFAQVSPAWADGGFTPLPFATFGDLLVDTVHGHEFITSNDQATDEVAVADVAGDLVTTIPGLPDASDMALSPDSSTLYVALPQSDQIAAVDTTDLSVTATYDTGAGTCPWRLAVTAGLVWYGGMCINDFPNSSLGALDPATGTAYPGLFAVGSGMPKILATPAKPETLIVATWGDNSDPSKLELLHVTGAPNPTVTVSAQRDVNTRADFALTPDGQGVLSSDGSSGSMSVLSTDDLSTTGSAPGTRYAPAAAVRADGLVAVASFNEYGPDLFLSQLGGDEVTRTFELGPAEHGVTWPAPGGMAFGPNNMYVVVGDPLQNNLALRTVDPLAAREPQITVSTDKDVYPYNAIAQITAHLGPGTANRDVTMHFKWVGPGPDNPPAEGTTTFSGQVDQFGNAVKLANVRQTIEITAHFAGDDPSDPSTAATSITKTIYAMAKVDEDVLGGYADDGRFRLFRKDARPSVSMRVQTPHPGACVHVHVDKREAGSWHRVRSTTCTRLDSKSRARLQLSPRHHKNVKLRVRTIWPGDASNVHTEGAWKYIKFAW